MRIEEGQAGSGVRGLTATTSRLDGQNIPELDLEQRPASIIRNFNVVAKLNSVVFHYADRRHVQRVACRALSRRNNARQLHTFMIIDVHVVAEVEEVSGHL